MNLWHAQVFGYQFDNGVPIASWDDDRADREFARVLPLLERLARVKDVRPHIAHHCCLHRCAPPELLKPDVQDTLCGVLVTTSGPHISRHTHLRQCAPQGYLGCKVQVQGPPRGVRAEDAGPTSRATPTCTGAARQLKDLGLRCPVWVARSALSCTLLLVGHAGSHPSGGLCILSSSARAVC